MYKFKPTPTTLIIKFKNQFHDQGENGIKIDTTYNPEHHIRIHAEVVGVPSRFESIPLATKYLGSPTPRKHGTKSKMTSLYYRKNIFYTAEDCEMDIRVGDTIYFHYLAIQYEQFGRQSQTYLNKDSDGYEYHQIMVDQLMAVIRDGELIPLLGRVFVQPIMEDEFDQNGFKFLKSKKMLQGRVTHVGPPIGDQDVDISVGDEVLYLNASEFENKIEGQYYYVMKHWFVVAKKVDGEYSPVGEYIKLDKQKEDSLFKIEGTANTRQMNGIVVGAGEKADASLIGHTAVINNSSPYFAQFDEKTIFVRHTDVFLLKTDKNGV